MAETIDIKVRTEPSGANELSTSLTTQAETVESAYSDVRSAGSTVGTELHGQTASTAYQSLTSQGSHIDTLASEMRSLSTALNSFASTMTSVKDRLQSARDDAAAVGLEISGDTISLPDTRGSAASGTDSTYEAKKEKFQEISTTVTQIRADEDEAHNTLQSACRGISISPAVETAMAVSSVSPYITWGGRAFNLADAYVWKVRTSQGRFAPKGPDGRFVKHPPKGAWARWANGKNRAMMLDPKNWVAKPGNADNPTWNKVKTIGKYVPKVQRALKVTGIAGSVAEGVVSGWDQYQEDSRNHPNMGEGEKKARAVTKGGLKAGTGYAAAVGGAKVGAAFGGMLGGPAGAVIGGVAGGVLGGLAGSKAGEAIGNAAASGVSKAKDFLGKIF